ncbi:Glycosyltransferase involved in cell wall bisynthesis [Dyadobacter soli]|uniref:Glycosyltransferase involved in cell wall bisynthesis n=1 Tax=Dyadobacter soli TaxID=659014 RepID=A0A1G6UNQ9_9BACT|nr:glycosyltransferase family 2 protein [Dyadobacter soli]SDD42185.1 Glycosyltransferase involved in cell wall bisynthesis [Dyadobacter soli]
MVSAQTTSLIIATYNWAEALHCSLLSVSKQKILPTEVVIADDGSDERTKELVRKMQEKFPVPIIHAWHEDLGFRKSQILNKAVGQCSGSYLIQVDGDVLLHSSFIQDHIAAAERGAFIRGTRARLTPAKTDELLRNADSTVSIFSKGVYNRFNAVRLPVLQSLGQRKEMKSRSVRGSNLAYWKDDFLRVNGYNNELSGWGHEDEELAARFINNNIIKKIVKLGAVQYHLHHEELPRSNEPFHREIIENTLLTKVKRCRNGYENLL